MDSEAPKERETYRHLGLISNEVINLEKGFQDMASREKQIREMLIMHFLVILSLLKLTTQ